MIMQSSVFLIEVSRMAPNFLIPIKAFFLLYMWLGYTMVVSSVYITKKNFQATYARPGLSH